jgi:glycosyltransferase involved in cell wall biosynthesis
MADSRQPDGILPGFLFTAGVLAPYRGTEDLINALALLAQRKVAFPPLVIAGTSGGASSYYETNLRRLAAKHGVERHIHWAGALSREEMSWCYRHCQAFIFTSRAEACPNIVLESMGHGCLNISCTHKPMPEFYQNSALYYDWGNSAMLADRIQQVLAMDGAAVDSWRNASRARIDAFTWDAAASETICVLKKAIQQFVV